MLKGFSDLHLMTEDDRIQIIGNAAREAENAIAFIVEDNAKADRYLAKLAEHFPDLEEERRFAFGPGICVKIQRKKT